MKREKEKPPLETIAVHHPKVILILFCLIFPCDRKELSSKISPRVLISAVTECYHKVVIKHKVWENTCLCVKFSKLLWAICERARDKLGLSFFLLQECVVSLMSLLADCVSGMTKEDIKTHQSNLFSLFLEVLDFRVQHTQEVGISNIYFVLYDEGLLRLHGL